jgi:hypothetical protein
MKRLGDDFFQRRFVKPGAVNPRRRGVEVFAYDAQHGRRMVVSTAAQDGF